MLLWFLLSSYSFLGGIFSLLSFQLPAARSQASDAHHRGPLEPAGVEGYAADDVEIIPGQGTRASDRHAGGGSSRHAPRTHGAITVVN
jgi:hypothetical protein